jgi:hypothetical protein
MTNPAPATPAHHPAIRERDTMSRTMSMNDVYRKYKPRILRLLASIKAGCEEAGYVMDDPFEMSDEEYKWMLSGKISADDDDREPDFDITITIAESRFNDGEDEFGINFSSSLVEYGGVIIGGCTPYNYSDDVWVSRKDPEAVEGRWRLFEGACDPSDIVSLIGDHYTSKTR